MISLRSTAGNDPVILHGMLTEHLKPRQRLLDLGIGTGLSALPFRQAGLEVNGIDGSEEMLKR